MERKDTKTINPSVEFNQEFLDKDTKPDSYQKLHDNIDFNDTNSDTSVGAGPPANSSFNEREDGEDSNISSEATIVMEWEDEYTKTDYTDNNKLEVLKAETDLTWGSPGDGDDCHVKMTCGEETLSSPSNVCDIKPIVIKPANSTEGNETRNESQSSHFTKSECVSQNKIYTESTSIGTSEPGLDCRLSDLIRPQRIKREKEVPEISQTAAQGRCVYSSLSSLVSAYIRDAPSSVNTAQVSQKSKSPALINSKTNFSGYIREHENISISHYKSKKHYSGYIDFDMIDGPTKLVVSVPRFYWNGDRNHVWKILDSQKLIPELKFDPLSDGWSAIKIEEEDYCDNSHLCDSGFCEGSDDAVSCEIKLENDVSSNCDAMDGCHIKKEGEELYHKVIGPKKVARQIHSVKGKPKSSSVYSCNVCGYESSHTGHLLLHIQLHNGEKPHQCRVCDKRLTTRQGLQIHMRTHTGEKPYQCHICNKCFSVGCSLKGHLTTHSKDQPFQCGVCGKRFSHTGNLGSHMKIHSNDHPYQCEICDKTFKFTTNLKIHFRTHTGEKPYICSICNKGFAQATHLKTHKRTHTGELPYKCTLCDKEFSQSSHMRTHLSTHTGERSCVCDLCGKSLANKRNLRIHMRTHTGELPFKCPECGKGFNQTPPLKTHIKMHHTGEKPYQCHYCGKSFAEFSMLKIHRRKHTGEKPYKCMKCDKAYTTAASLRWHEKTCKSQAKKTHQNKEQKNLKEMKYENPLMIQNMDDSNESLHCKPQGNKKIDWEDVDAGNSNAGNYHTNVKMIDDNNKDAGDGDG